MSPQVIEEPEAGHKDKGLPATKRVKKGVGQDMESIDLDVTPLMNIMMVLIPFLITMAVFTQIAVVDFSLPPAQAQASAAGPAVADSSKALDISVVITNDGFRIVGTGKKLDIIPRARGQYQFDQLRMLLKAIKFEYPSQQSVVLVIDSEVLYDDVIKFMDVCRESQFPDIGLSGAIG